MKTKTCLIYQLSFRRFTVFMLCVVFAACKNSTDVSEMAGTYVNHEGGAYSIADDTLVVEHQQASQFLIHRRTGFHLIREGKKGKREYETERWMANYDTQIRVMNVLGTGKVLAFYPDRLMVGSREYKKLRSDLERH